MAYWEVTLAFGVFIGATGALIGIYWDPKGTWLCLYQYRDLYKERRIEARIRSSRCLGMVPYD